MFATAMQILVRATQQALLMAKIGLGHIVDVNSKWVLCLVYTDKPH
jgi:hypothetical protein